MLNNQFPQNEKVYMRSFTENGQNSLSKLAQRVPENSKVLDVGCGNADLGSYLKENKGCHVTGIDYSEAGLENAKAKIDSACVVDLNSSLISDVFNEKFDVIIFADILEHVYEPERILSDVKDLLAENGKILISIPNAGYIGALLSLYEGEWVYREEGILDTTHVRFYTGISLLNLAYEAGFHGVVVDRVTKDLTESEFTQRLDVLPASVRDWLCAKPEASTYQFIFEGTCLEQGVKPTVSTPVTLKHLTKLYLKSSTNNFTEENTWFSHGEMGQINTHRFEIGKGEISELKFQYADRAGIFELFEVHVLDKGQCIGILTALNSAVFDKSNHYTDSCILPLKLIATNEGANFTVALNEVLSGDDLVVEIKMHAPVSPDSLSFIPHVPASLYSDELKKIYTTFLNAQHDLNAQVEAQFDQVEAQFGQIESISKLYQEGISYQRKLEMEIEQHQQEKADLSERLSQLQSAHSNVLGSTSWKVTLPLRKLKSFKNKL